MGLKDILYPLTVWKNFFRVPVTVRRPEKREGPERYRGFHYNDTDKCIGCGTCESICQNAAIDMVPVEGKNAQDGDSGLRPRIDYGRCCWCALCVDICTTNSLRMTNRFRWAQEGVNATDTASPAGAGPDAFRFVPGTDDKYWNTEEKGYRKPDNYDLTPPDRVPMDHLDAEERGGSFIEMMKGYSRGQARKEADRCVECGICTATCPAHMGIPEYIKAIRNDDLEEGLRILYETNPLPEVCGRVCTHKCETVCSVGNKGDAISIRWLKRYIADNVDADKYKEILGTGRIEPNGKKVAIVGAGASGLSAAHYLALLGYGVTLYEAQPQAGGMMRYGIPEYRLPYDTIDKDINYILSLGVELKSNTRVGTDVTLQELKDGYDAVFMGTGLHLGRSTRIDNADHKMVFQAIDLLRDITKGKEIPLGKKVVVIGGGNVAMDITRSVARLQKKKYGTVDVLATCLEKDGEMPADVEEINEAREEGAVLTPGYGPQAIELDDAGGIKGLHVWRCLGIFDEKGAFNPRFDRDDARFYEADMVIESIGQGADLGYLPDDVKEAIEWSPRRQVVTDGDFQVKNVPWLFAGGDIVNGPDVIHGIANGHLAAKGIDRYLRGGNA